MSNIGEETLVVAEEAALKIVLQLCSALSFLHKRAIIHRDVKLDNLLFDDDANVKLCDWGFARFSNEEDFMTRLGTPAYIAPEIYDT